MEDIGGVKVDWGGEDEECDLGLVDIGGLGFYESVCFFVGN